MEELAEGFERKEIALGEYIAWLHHSICLKVESITPNLISLLVTDTHKYRGSLKSLMGNINSANIL
jgi:hypothetical protein